MADFYNYIYIDEDLETVNEYAAAELLEEVGTLSGEELETMKEQALSHYHAKLAEISALREQISGIWHEIRINNDLDKIITDQLEKLESNI